jgi:hypothetical protein
MSNFEISHPEVKGAAETANKAVNAALAFVGTYAGVLIADIAEAAGWVNQLIVVAGGTIGVARVYWAKNRPKR